MASSSDRPQPPPESSGPPTPPAPSRAPADRPPPGLIRTGGQSASGERVAEVRGQRVERQRSALPPPPAGIPPTSSPPRSPAAYSPAVAPPSIAVGPDHFSGERFLRPLPEERDGPWRRVLRGVSGGRWGRKLSPADELLRDRLLRISTRITRSQRIVVGSGKGGVGKTTVTLLCGTALSLHRGDRVVALDANPDAGSLGWRVRRETTATVTDLLRDVGAIRTYSDLRNYTNQATSRLEVIASANDPGVSQALADADYATALQVLERHFSMVLCDLGTGLLDNATQGLLARAHEVVVVAAPSLDAGRVASFTLDFIERRHVERVRNAVVVINNIRPDTLVDVDELEGHFRGRVRTVVRVPFDPHLATGGEPEWEGLQTATRDAYLELAAAVVDGLPAAARSA